MVLGRQLSVTNPLPQVMLDSLVVPVELILRQK